MKLNLSAVEISRVKSRGEFINAEPGRWQGLPCGMCAIAIISDPGGQEAVHTVSGPEEYMNVWQMVENGQSLSLYALNEEELVQTC